MFINLSNFPLPSFASPIISGQANPQKPAGITSASTAPAPSEAVGFNHQLRQFTMFQSGQIGNKYLGLVTDKTS